MLDGTGREQLNPVRISSLSNEVIAVAVGKHHSLILYRGGFILACGKNSVGQLGDGSNRKSLEFIDVFDRGALIEKNISRIGATGAVSVALDTDGGLYTWVCIHFSMLISLG